VFYQEATVDEAITRMAERQLLQPCLFRAHGRFFLKVDNKAIMLSTASCFVEAVERLFMSFFVFNVQYPHTLKTFYCFLEIVMGMREATTPIVRDFLRQLTVK